MYNWIKLERLQWVIEINSGLINEVDGQLNMKMRDEDEVEAQDEIEDEPERDILRLHD